MRKVAGKFFEGEKINRDIYLMEAENENFQLCKSFNGRLSDKLFRIYLLSYIKKSITHKSIDIKNKRKKINQREYLILNTTIDEFDEDYINTIPDTSSENYYEKDTYDKVIDFQEIVTNIKILQVINVLTYRQREVLYMFYVLEKSEKEIADELLVTIQAINKTRNLALRKIRRSIGGEQGGNFH